ncbi:hypothetical protein [Kitasatospora sp. NPDC057198]|uniref:hypothetical protein n=1 Tax=Kitasatospora sp. NPDC057198 TaxID=3346046 RepID=UPI003644864B
MNRLNELWAARRMPLRCGLFRADGTGREADCDGAELTRFALGEPFGPAAADRALADHTSADVFAVAALPDGSGRLVGGGGSHGSDGFFARLGPRGELRWLVHLLCNELVEVAVDWPTATLTNNCGNTLTIDLASPEFSDSPRN